MSEENLVAETRQRVIAMMLEARTLIRAQADKVREIREQEDLGPTRRQQALEEVVTPASTRTTELVRDARLGVRGGWGVGAGGVGTPTRPWDQGLSPQGLEARDGMLQYIDAAERVFTVELEELGAPPGEAPSAEAVADRDAAAAEVASYEEMHPAPAGVAAAEDRLPTIQ